MVVQYLSLVLLLLGVYGYPAFPTCPTNGQSCALTSNQAAQMTVPANSAMTLYFDVEQDMSSLDVDFNYPVGKVVPKLYWRPWEAPVIDIFDGGMEALCGVSVTSLPFTIKSPYPGRYFFVVANDDPSLSTPPVTLTVTANKCPLAGFSGEFCTPINGSYTPPLQLQIGDVDTQSLRPIASYSFDTTTFPAETWGAIVVTATISGAINLMPYNYPTVSIDLGSVGTATMADMDEEWRSLAHGDCGPSKFTGLTCTFSLANPKRGRYYLNVFLPTTLPTVPYTLDVSVDVQASGLQLYGPDEYNGQPIAADWESGNLYYDVTDSSDFAFTVCPSAASNFDNMAIAVSFNGLATTDDENCNVAASMEKNAPHWYFTRPAPGRYFIKTAGIPTDGSYVIHVSQSLMTCVYGDGGGDGDSNDEDEYGYALLITWLVLCACGCCLTLGATAVVAGVILYNRKNRDLYETLNDKPTLYDNL